MLPKVRSNGMSSFRSEVVFELLGLVRPRFVLGWI